jgi:hypothetical protein
VAWEWAKVIAATILQQLDEDWSKLVNKCLSCNSSNHFAKGCDDEEAKAAVAAAKMKKEVQQKIDSKKKKSNARANTAAAEESNGSSGCESDADSDGDFKLKGTGKGPKTEAKVQIENYYGTILKSSGVHNIICKLQIQALAEGMRCSMGFE